jgi:hypothetical protein
MGACLSGKVSARISEASRGETINYMLLHYHTQIVYTCMRGAVLFVECSTLLRGTST